MAPEFCYDSTMSEYRIGSEAWYDANPTAPSRAEADADAALDERWPMPRQDGPLTWAVATSGEREREHRRLNEEWEALGLPF